jgi:hypothetical protein
MAEGMARAITQVNQDFAEIDAQLFALVYNVSSINRNSDERVRFCLNKLLIALTILGLRSIRDRAELQLEDGKIPGKQVTLP